ncbi:MAG: hypothetical protein JW781_09120 [Deltaproteobacteria bacterium]|nr:hypothetical protein [Candidatus Anaeroferrophillacea bacterium]
MKIVGFITDYPVIRKILKHLDLWERPPPVAPVLPGVASVPPSPRPFAGEALVYEPFDDGWPGYEEPVCAVKGSGQVTGQSWGVCADIPENDSIRHNPVRSMLL